MADPAVTLLMTRPSAASRRFVDSLPVKVRNQMLICLSPLIDIVPIAQPIRFEDATAILFTSANGVATASALDARRDLPCFCVGMTTTQAAQDAGWIAQCVGETSDDMVLWASGAAPARYLHLRGTNARGDIAARLTRMGRPAREQAIYDQKLLSLTDAAVACLNRENPVIAPIFSPRTARHFANQLTGFAPVYVAALSDAVAEPLRTTGIRALRVADHPTASAMKTEIEILMNQVCRVEGDQGAQ